MQGLTIGLVTAVLATALTTPATAAPRATEPDWVNCGVDAQCAKVSVPLEWDRPSGAKITLAVDRHKTDPATRKGVLFLAPGVGFDMVIAGIRQGLLAQMPEVLRDFDIVGVDPRGGGLHPFNGRLPAPFRSDSIECTERVHDPAVNSFPRNETEYAELVRHNRAYAASCANPLLDHMDTTNIARDLDAVRAALGESTVSMFLYGYGGPLTQTYASLFPQRIRAIAVDSPPDHTVPSAARVAGYALTVEREFTKFAEWCDRSPWQPTNPAFPGCQLHGQDVGAVYDSVLRQGDTRPVRLDLPPEPGRPGPAETVLVRGNDLAFLTEQLLEIGDMPAPYGLGWSNLSIAISQAAQGVSPTFASVYRYSWGYRDLWNPIRAGGCQDFPAQVKDFADLKARERLVAALAPHTRGASQAWDMMTGCIGWPAAGTNPPKPSPAPDAPPILIVGARGNPWAPYEGLLATAAQIRRSVVLTYEGDAHIAFLSSPCVVRNIEQYLVTAVAPPAGSSCPAIPT
ncbi:alpha/beta hydrolase [Actinocrispum sp. NPDC049592]|uniref:alpha/beta hydrolase n=1 Tax=Actinocrispum sp. NPDC049592 TaxID=3154835 RepID=UPI00343E22BF